MTMMRMTTIKYNDDDTDDDDDNKDDDEEDFNLIALPLRTKRM